MFYFDKDLFISLSTAFLHEIKNYKTYNELKKCDPWSMKHNRMIHIQELSCRDFKITIIKMPKIVAEKMNKRG